MVIGKPEQKTNLVQISVQPKWENPGKGNKKLSGFYVEFRNPGKTPVYIVWEKSILEYSNRSYVPFVEGQRYELYPKPMEALLIPPRGVVRKYIYSPQQLYQEAGKSGNWKLKPIEADQVFLSFYMQSANSTDYYTVVVR
ncbi:MAG: hypothetical protein PHT55_02555, partial [Spirochaetales bacterium]|nr:hypothetical protein [Spirochaetales bacterium]